MGLLNIIRRMHLRQKLSIREIARLTGVSRNTVTKHLAANTIEPKFATPDRQSKIDPFAEKLAGWLKTEAGKSRKERRTVKQLHADLVTLGFTGSYARVAAFARRWKADRQREQQTTGRGTFVPLHFDPGDAFQFDWSEDFAVLGGERAKLQMAHIKLAHSRAFLLRAYPLQTHEMLFDAHWHAFRVFGGVPGRGIYDNMKTAVDRVGRGKERRGMGEGSGREERPGCPTPVAARDAGLSRPCRAERLAGTALPRTMAADGSWQAGRHDCRCLVRGAGGPDAIASGL